MNQASKFRLSLSDFSPAQLVVVFPVFHLLMSTLFLWAYCVGFGLNLAIFTTASDIFTFAISSMVPIYLISFIWPLIYLAQRYSREHPFAIDEVKSIADPEQQSVAMSSLNKTRYRLKFGLWALTFAIILIESWNFYHGNRINFVLLSAIPNLHLVIFFSNLKEKWYLDNLTYEVAILFVSFAVTCVAFGLERGQSDRRKDYAIFQDDFLQCDKNLVIRKIGDSFLVVKPDNTKAMVSQECKELFREAPKPKAPKELPAPATKVAPAQMH